MIAPDAMKRLGVPSLLALIAFIALVGYQAYALWLGQTFDPSAFGEAAGWIMGGSGAIALGQGFMARSRIGRGANIRPDNPDA